ncbi:MAG: lipid II flippase MurJ [Pseudomonadota bacterium]
MSRSRTPLAVVSAVNLLANLLFPVLAIRALGAGSAADALFMVFILPGVVMVLLSNSVLNWITPRLVRRADAGSRRALCWSLLWVLLAGMVVLCIVLAVPAQLALPYLAAGSGYALAVAILPAGFVAMLASVVTAVAQSLFTAERAVLAGELRTLAANMAAAMVWLLVDPSTLTDCALLFALRAVLGSAFMATRLGRLRAPGFSDRDLREVLRESRVLLVAATYYKSEPFVDRLLFATVSGGAVAAFHLAHQIMSVVTLLMNRVVTATLVAPLAEAVHAGNGHRARRLLARSLAGMVLAGVVFWLLFLLGGEALLTLLFAGTDTGSAHITLTVTIFLLLGGYMLGVLLGQVLGQMYYTTGDTRTMMAVGIAGYTLGLALRAVALWQFGAAGLAAAISLSWLVNLLMYYGFRPAVFRSEGEQHGQ